MAPADAQYRQQARLWSASVGISALINLLAVLLIAVWISFRWVLAPLFSEMLGLVGLDPGFLAEVPPPPPPPAESVAMIVPEAAPVSLRTPPPTAAPFARTSKDQESARPEKPAFIGNRNTTATRDAPAAAQAPEMPGQTGREPRDEDDVETTVSRYQEGDLAHDSIAPPPPAEPAPPAPEKMAAAEPPPSGSSPEPAANERQGDPAPPMEALATGPYQVDRQVKDESPPESPKPPAPPERRSAAQAQENPANPTPGKLPGPAATAKVPGFRGNQRKTQLSGSITRQGRSALDVEDSPLGRYHASLSRAVEAEWEPACVRNEKYLTAGQIIVRFVLDPSGKVRSLTFVEEFGVGNIQKGFTSESIRTADIPPFPAELKKQLGGEPLEITYSFTF